MSDDDVRDEDGSPAEPDAEEPTGSAGDEPEETEVADDEPEEPEEGAAAPSTARTRATAVPERPSRRKKAPPPRAPRGGRGARRRRFGVVHAVILVALVLLVARIATMVADDGPISGGTWASLAAIIAVLLIAVTNLLEQRGRLRAFRGRGLAALGGVLVLAAISVTAVIATDSSPQLGLDLQGGYSVVLSPQGDPPSDNIDQAIEIIRQRIDGLGVAEPEITRQGDNVVVDLPGVRDREQAQEIVGQTAQLEFRPVRAAGLPFDAEAAAAGEDPCAAAAEAVAGATAPADGTTPGGAVPGDTVPGDTIPGETTPGDTAPDGTAPADTGSTEAPATEEEGAPALPGSSAVTDGEHALGPLPRQEDSTTTTTGDTTTTTAPGDTTTSTAPAGEEPAAEEPGTGDVVFPTQADGDEPRSCVQMGPVGITGDALSKAQAQLGGSTGSEWVVAIRVESGQQDAANALFNMCNVADPTSCPSGQMAIVLDDEVVSAPTVNEANLASDEFVITGGRDEATGRGGFAEGEAKDLALVLRYGALPVEFTTGAERQVSPTVGEDSLRAGIIAGLIGLGVVILYLLLYYRALGLIVVLGMFVWSALMYGLVTWLSSTQGLTLSLSGVVGIVISIGTTVDSYVVHFERLKDEVRLGKSVRSSTERGFQLAFRTIVTANVAALIGAALLWWLTVGAVRGFAFFLGLSVLLDLFVIWTFERPMVALFARSRFFTEHPIFGVARGLGSRTGRPAAAGAGASR